MYEFRRYDVAPGMMGVLNRRFALSRPMLAKRRPLDPEFVAQPSGDDAGRLADLAARQCELDADLAQWRDHASQIPQAHALTARVVDVVPRRGRDRDRDHGPR